MGLVDAEVFGDAPCSRIYIAGRLREAKDIELVLTNAGIDYVIEVEKFGKKLLGVIPREYHGAAFYVLATHADAARQLLVEARFRAGLVEDDEEDDEGDVP